MRKGDKEFYKSIGICPYCRKHPIMGDEKVCPECLVYFADKNRERYAKFGRKDIEEFNKKQRDKYKERVKGKVCTRCGRIAQPNKKKCSICLEKDRLSAMKYRERKMSLKVGDLVET